jgi:acyl-CoA dehydrogenase
MIIVPRDTPGVSDDSVIAHLFTINRYLRIADGPDEVRMSQLGAQKIRDYNTKNAR